MGLNFLDHPPLKPRTIFRDREPEPEPAAPGSDAPAAARCSSEPSDAEVTTVLFRTLKRFPEAYRAVVEAMRQLSPDFAPA